jgi:hypothetical protein
VGHGSSLSKHDTSIADEAKPCWCALFACQNHSIWVQVEVTSTASTGHAGTSNAWWCTCLLPLLLLAAACMTSAYLPLIWEGPALHAATAAAAGPANALPSACLPFMQTGPALHADCSCWSWGLPSMLLLTVSNLCCPVFCCVRPSDHACKQTRRISESCRPQAAPPHTA